MAEQVRNAGVVDERQQPHLPHEARLPGEQGHLQRHVPRGLVANPEGAIDDAIGAMPEAVDQQPLLHLGAHGRTEEKTQGVWRVFHEVPHRGERNLLPPPARSYLIRHHEIHGYARGSTLPVGTGAMRLTAAANQLVPATCG